MSVLDDVNQHRNELRTDSYTTTISDLLSAYKRGDLHINPEYQRLFRWDLQSQSEYIESLLLNIPTPPLFFATNPDGKNEVIDGLQRLSTLIKFFASEIFENSSFATERNNEDEQNNIQVGTMLLEAPLVTSLDGYTLSTLPETLTRILRYTRVPIILLEQESSQRARYHVFKRLNRSGSVLTDQEIRNSSARLFGNEFPEALRTLAENEYIKKALNLPDQQVKSMTIDEYILRLLANVYNPTPLKHSVTELLDDFMEYASEGKFQLDKSIIERVELSFMNISNIFPNGEAFRYWRDNRAQGQFSPNLFDIISYGVFKNIDALKENPELIKTKIHQLHDNEELKELVGAGSNTRKKYLGRLTLGESWFKIAG